MAKPKNAFLAAVNKEVLRRMSKYEHTRMQMAQDAAFMAANEVLKLGPGRAEAFGKAFIKYIDEITTLINEDAKGDKSVEYAKAVIDRRILPIVGEELFVEFDERYGRR